MVPNSNRKVRSKNLVMSYFKSGFKVENQIFGEDHFSVVVFLLHFFQKK